MNTDYDATKNTWTITQDDKTTIFNEMAMAVAWGDPTDNSNKLHCVCVGGRGEDNRIRILNGFSGYWDELVKHAIDFKDLLFIKRCYVWPYPNEYVTLLRKEDGFSRYKTARSKLSMEEIPISPPETWPHFRSPKHKASIIPIVDNIVQEFEPRVVKFEQHKRGGDILIPKRQWRDLTRVLNRPLSETIRFSSLRAAVILAEMLIPREMSHDKIRTQRPIYKNLRR